MINKFKGLRRSRIKDFNKKKPLSPEKKGEKVPKFIMTKFGDEQLNQYIREYQERKNMSSFNETPSMFTANTNSTRRNF